MNMDYLYKPDFEMSWKRYQAFWEREIIDRPPVCFAFRKDGARLSPPKRYATYEEQWLDLGGRVERMDEAMAATGCDSMRQMRDVIAHVREHATAAVDNGAISALVRARLTEGGR